MSANVREAFRRSPSQRSLSFTTPALAGWQEQATTVDQQRLSQLQAARAQGLSEAASGRDMGAIHEALNAPSHGAARGRVCWRRGAAAR